MDNRRPTVSSHDQSWMGYDVGLNQQLGDVGYADQMMQVNRHGYYSGRTAGPPSMYDSRSIPPYYHRDLTHPSSSYAPQAYPSYSQSTFLDSHAGGHLPYGGYDRYGNVVGALPHSPQSLRNNRFSAHSGQAHWNNDGIIRNSLRQSPLQDLRHSTTSNITGSATDGNFPQTSQASIQSAPAPNCPSDINQSQASCITSSSSVTGNNRVDASNTFGPSCSQGSDNTVCSNPSPHELEQTVLPHADGGKVNVTQSNSEHSFHLQNENLTSTQNTERLHEIKVSHTEKSIDERPPTTERALPEENKHESISENSIAQCHAIQEKPSEQKNSRSLSPAQPSMERSVETEETPFAEKQDRGSEIRAQDDLPPTDVSDVEKARDVPPLLPVLSTSGETYDKMADDTQKIHCDIDPSQENKRYPPERCANKSDAKKSIESSPSLRTVRTTVDLSGAEEGCSTVVKFQDGTSKFIKEEPDCGNSDQSFYCYSQEDGNQILESRVDSPAENNRQGNQMDDHFPIVNPELQNGQQHLLVGDYIKDGQKKSSVELKEAEDGSRSPSSKGQCKDVLDASNLDGGPVKAGGIILDQLQCNENEQQHLLVGDYIKDSQKKSSVKLKEAEDGSRSPSSKGKCKDVPDASNLDGGPVKAGGIILDQLQCNENEQQHLLVGDYIKDSQKKSSVKLKEAEDGSRSPSSKGKCKDVPDASNLDGGPVKAGGIILDQLQCNENEQQHLLVGDYIKDNQKKSSVKLMEAGSRSPSSKGQCKDVPDALNLDVGPVKAGGIILDQLQCNEGWRVGSSDGRTSSTFIVPPGEFNEGMFDRCPLCEEFVASNDMIEHPYKCKAKPHQQPAIVAAAVPAHDDDATHNCPECGVGFQTTDDLVIHLRIHEMLTKNAQKMQEENQMMAMTEQLGQHMPGMGDLTGEPEECEVCFENFTDPTMIPYHNMMHQQFPFHCRKCNLFFPTLSDLYKTRCTDQKRHKVFKYRCKKCKGVISDSFKMRKHRKRCEGKVEICRLCKKKFPSFKQLAAHAEVCNEAEKEEDKEDDEKDNERDDDVTDRAFQENEVTDPSSEDYPTVDAGIEVCTGVDEKDVSQRYKNNDSVVHKTTNPDALDPLPTDQDIANTDKFSNVDVRPKNESSDANCKTLVPQEATVAHGDDRLNSIKEGNETREPSSPSEVDNRIVRCKVCGKELSQRYHGRACKETPKYCKACLKMISIKKPLKMDKNLLSQNDSNPKRMLPIDSTAESEGPCGTAVKEPAKKKHKKDQDDSETCGACGKCFKNFDKLVKHAKKCEGVKNQHNRGVCTEIPEENNEINLDLKYSKEYQCNGCNKKFAKKRKFKKHVKACGWMQDCAPTGSSEDSVSNGELSLTTPAHVESDAASVAHMESGVASLVTNESSEASMGHLGLNVKSFDAADSNAVSVASPKSNVTCASPVELSLADGESNISKVASPLSNEESVSHAKSGATCVGAVESSVVSVTSVDSKEKASVAFVETSISAVESIVTPIAPPKPNAASATVESSFTNVGPSVSGPSFNAGVLALVGDALVESSASPVVSGESSSNSVAAMESGMDLVAPGVSRTASVGPAESRVSPVAHGESSPDSVAAMESGVPPVAPGVTRSASVSTLESGIAPQAHSSTFVDSVAIAGSSVSFISPVGSSMDSAVSLDDVPQSEDMLSPTDAAAKDSGSNSDQASSATPLEDTSTAIQQTDEVTKKCRKDPTNRTATLLKQEDKREFGNNDFTILDKPLIDVNSHMPVSNGDISSIGKVPSATEHPKINDKLLKCENSHGNFGQTLNKLKSKEENLTVELSCDGGNLHSSKPVTKMVQSQSQNRECKDLSSSMSVAVKDQETLEASDICNSSSSSLIAVSKAPKEAEPGHIVSCSMSQQQQSDKNSSETLQFFTDTKEDEHLCINVKHNTNMDGTSHEHATLPAKSKNTGVHEPSLASLIPVKTTEDSKSVFAENKESGSKDMTKDIENVGFNSHKDTLACPINNKGSQGNDMSHDDKETSTGLLGDKCKETPTEVPKGGRDREKSVSESSNFHGVHTGAVSAFPDRDTAVTFEEEVSAAAQTTFKEISDEEGKSHFPGPKEDISMDTSLEMGNIVDLGASKNAVPRCENSQGHHCVYCAAEFSSRIDLWKHARGCRDNHLMVIQSSAAGGEREYQLVEKPVGWGNVPWQVNNDYNKKEAMVMKTEIGIDLNCVLPVLGYRAPPNKVESRSDRRERRKEKKRNRERERIRRERRRVQQREKRMQEKLKENDSKISGFVKVWKSSEISISKLRWREHIGIDLSSVDYKPTKAERRKQEKKEEKEREKQRKIKRKKRRKQEREREKLRVQAKLQKLDQNAMKRSKECQPSETVTCENSKKKFEKHKMKNISSPQSNQKSLTLCVEKLTMDDIDRHKISKSTELPGTSKLKRGSSVMEYSKECNNQVDSVKKSKKSKSKKRSWSDIEEYVHVACSEDTDRTISQAKISKKKSSLPDNLTGLSNLNHIFYKPQHIKVESKNKKKKKKKSHHKEDMKKEKLEIATRPQPVETTTFPDPLPELEEGMKQTDRESSKGKSQKKTWKQNEIAVQYPIVIEVECPDCGMKFSHQSTLDRHSRLHRT